MLRTLAVVRSIPALGIRHLSSIPKIRTVVPHFLAQNAWTQKVTLTATPEVSLVDFLRTRELAFPVDPVESVRLDVNENVMQFDSVLRKRRLKMKKHKLRKRRRAQRSLKKRLGKL